MLGLLLLIFLFDDNNDENVFRISKVVDDLKLWSEVASDEYVQKLQEDFC